LKIPWKNLYSEPVVAKVDGVYLLARPNTGNKSKPELTLVLKAVRKN
jgi:vacuolar protein sorting-associated protein 13A/C